MLHESRNIPRVGSSTVDGDGGARNTDQARNSGRSDIHSLESVRNRGISGRLSRLAYNSSSLYYYKLYDENQTYSTEDVRRCIC